ncbi:hypothetical protein VTL71DRAFT_13894 [Oculimacula yallundae]|uniref:AB hydrolase-1 domain-containing protein n=1 Tax=Oculimacula yallundae TaxID=86028 RepID=A0ABR4CNI5_9HELO
MSSSTTLTHATVLSEECNLSYTYIGTGPLIIFIPGGNGHSLQYYPLMTHLSSTYTSVTFSRRQMSLSTLLPPTAPQVLNPYQQARDVLAIIHAMGFTKSIIFGSSLGGIIAFQFATDFPSAVDHLIVHEAPTFHLLPDARELADYFFQIYNTYKSRGLQAVSEIWGKHFSIMRDENREWDPLSSPDPRNAGNFFENEFLVGTFWRVDFENVKGSGVSVGVMRGRRSGDEFFARATVEQKRVLGDGCVLEMVPGHHQGFESESWAFKEAFEGMLGRLEGKRRGNAGNEREDGAE